MNHAYLNQVNGFSIYHCKLNFNKYKMINTNFKDSVVNDYQKATENNPYQRVIVSNHLIDSIGVINSKNILDVGCGFGRHIKFLLENFTSFNLIVGIDKSNDQIKICKETIKYDSKIKFYIADIIDDDIFTILDKNSFDIIYNNFVITYCNDTNEVEKFLKNCFDLLKVCGTFVLIYNNHKNGLVYNPKVYEILKAGARTLTKDGDYYEGCPMESIMSKECKVKLNYYSVEFLVETMKRIGFSDIEIKNVYLKEKALEGFTHEELDIIIESRIFIMINAKKL